MSIPTKKGPIIEELSSDDEVEQPSNTQNPSYAAPEATNDAEDDDDSDSDAVSEDEPAAYREYDTSANPKSKEIIDGPSKIKTADVPADELAAILERVEALKLEGNELYNKKDFDAAVAKYTDAIRMLPQDHANTAVLLGNRSAALLSLENWERVIQDTTGAISLNPEHMKAFVRRAQAYEKQQKYSAALEDWKKAAELDPKLASAKEALVRLPPLVQEQQEKEKAEMIGQLKDLGNKFLGLFGMSVDNFKMEKDPSTGSYKLNFSK